MLLGTILAVGIGATIFGYLEDNISIISAGMLIIVLSSYLLFASPQNQQSVEKEIQGILVENINNEGYLMLLGAEAIEPKKLASTDETHGYNFKNIFAIHACTENNIMSSIDATEKFTNGEYNFIVIELDKKNYSELLIECLKYELQSDTKGMYSYLKRNIKDFKANYEIKEIN